MKNRDTIQLRLPVSDKARLKKIARARRASISDVIRGLILELIAKESAP